MARAGRPASFVYPERRRADFLAAAGESGLAARRLRFVTAGRRAAQSLSRRAGARHGGGDKGE